MTLNYFANSTNKPADCNNNNQTQFNYNNIKNVIKVFANGEISLNPDLIRAWVVLTARKDTPGLCRSSIEKRANYLRKSFKSLKIENQMISTSKSNTGRYFYQLTWRVHLPNFETWQKVRDVISEKIDHVTISKPEFGYLPKTIEKARRTAYLKAVELGKDKAKIAAEVVNMVIKHAISIEELECNEKMILETGNPDNDSDDGDDGGGSGDNWGSVLRPTRGKNSGLKLMNLNLTSKLCLSFELMDRC